MELNRSDLETHSTAWLLDAYAGETEPGLATGDAPQELEALRRLLLTRGVSRHNLRRLDLVRAYRHDRHAWRVVALSVVVILATSYLFWPFREIFETHSWDQSRGINPWFAWGAGGGPSVVVLLTVLCRRRLAAMTIAGVSTPFLGLPLLIFLPLVGPWLVAYAMVGGAMGVGWLDVLFLGGLPVCYVAITVESVRAVKRGR